MLIKDNKHWHTTNAYNFSAHSPLHKSLFDIEQDTKRREIIKKHFVVETDKSDACCFLTYHGRYISAWNKGDGLEAYYVIQAAVNMYTNMGGK